MSKFNFSTEKDEMNVHMTLSKYANKLSSNDLKSIYETVGLKYVIKMFKLFGFCFDSNDAKTGKKTSRYMSLICCDYILLSVGVAMAVLAFYDWFLISEFNVSYLCLWLGLYVSHFLVFFIYSHICFTLSKFSAHLQTISMLMYQMRIHECSPLFSQRLQRNAKLGSAFSFIIATCMTVVFVIVYEIIVVNEKYDYLDIAICRVKQAILCLWICMATLFYYFITFTYMLFCQMLSLIADIYVTDHNDCKQAISQRLHKHQILIILIRHTDFMFSTFMMATLVYELIVIIVFIQLIQSGFFDYINSPIAIFNVIQLVTLIVKNVVCSNLNEKIKSSLTLRNVPNSIQDLESCSAEHINYILYLNEQLINRAELTYGGFFPVRKTFIFTIAGTAFTYALVLNEINS